MLKLFLPASSLLLLSACNLIPNTATNPDPGIAAPVSVETAPLDAIDDTESEAAPSFTGTASTVAGLGDPTVPGLWMETPLVTSEQMGLVRSASGAEVTLTLRPVAGEASAGSRLSIDAMRALGAPLTELIELQVSAAS